MNPLYRNVCMHIQLNVKRVQLPFYYCLYRDEWSYRFGSSVLYPAQQSA